MPKDNSYFKKMSCTPQAGFEPETFYVLRVHVVALRCPVSVTDVHMYMKASMRDLRMSPDIVCVHCMCPPARKHCSITHLWLGDNFCTIPLSNPPSPSLLSSSFPPSLPPSLSAFFIPSFPPSLPPRLICEQKFRLGRSGLEDFKSHPFFRGVDWDNIWQMPPPYKPEYSSPIDTRNFDLLEENDSFP